MQKRDECRILSFASGAFFVSFRARSAREENMRKKQKSKISAHLGESFTKPGPRLPESSSYTVVFPMLPPELRSGRTSLALA